MKLSSCFPTIVVDKKLNYLPRTIAEYDPLLCLQLPHPSIVLAKDHEHLVRLHNGISGFLDESEYIVYPGFNLKDLWNSRFNNIKSLVNLTDNKKTKLFLTTIQALKTKIPNLSLFRGQKKTLVCGTNFNFQELLEFLQTRGYQRQVVCRNPGDYSLRGGIIDVFLPQYDKPMRLDFFSNDLESIRSFDPLTQRTIKNENQVNIYPATKLQYSNSQFDQEIENWDFVDQKNYEEWGKFDNWPYSNKVFLVEQLKNYFSSILHFDDSGQILQNQKIQPWQLDSDIITQDEWENKIGKYKHIYIDEDSSSNSLNITRIPPLSFLSKHIDKNKQEKKQIIFSCLNEEQQKEIEEICFLWNLGDIPVFVNGTNLPDKIPSIFIVYSFITKGFETPNCLWLTWGDLTGKKFNQRRLAIKRDMESCFQELESFSKGDIIVHIDYGVGRFEGLLRIDVDKVECDCLLLIYDKGDKVYVPVENIHCITRYGHHNTQVSLDRLGSVSWQERKARVKAKLLAMAQELVKIAALRKQTKVSPMEVCKNKLEEFCKKFPFLETQDQEKAIYNVLQDLSSGRVMDRLVFGDVGFGKTEVALRASFISVSNYKQVAIIVPTTILCQQHESVFKERFSDTGYKVASLSRFNSIKEKQKILQELAVGSINIIIGTHSLLSDKVSFFDLGLIVIDEEQRFGVKQKEKLKNIKDDLHILTLTATPIPRTLQSSLGGLRDMSMLSTAPIERQPVYTVVRAFSSEWMSQALLQEKSRGGLSFYITPRIAYLPSIHSFFEKNLPELSYTTIHGQMQSNDIDKRMIDFTNKKYDVLIATDIIGAGLDLPDANTIIVDQSQLFGLAQLYQLKGRVGRSSIQGMAYFFYDDKLDLTQQARARLDVLKSLDNLGSGFQLASHDLDIRGCGNVLGKEQSGHIKEVGIELYQKMLNEASSSLQEEKVKEIIWYPKLKIGLHVDIPKSYITEESLRLSFYKRISNCQNKKDLNNIQEELVDRFGKIPSEVFALFLLIEIRNLCYECSINSIELEKRGYLFSFYENTCKDFERFMSIVSEFPDRFLFDTNSKIILKKNWLNAKERVQKLYKFLLYFNGL